MSSIDLKKIQNKDKTVSVKQHETQTDFIEKASEVLNADIKLFEKKFGNVQKESFYSELGLLLSSGIDIKTALEIIEEQLKVKKHRNMINEIKNDVIAGNAVWESVKKHAVFSNYEYQSIKIGEESGKLPEVLIELGKFYTSAIKLKRQIIGTLTYPVVVLVLSILIVQFMLSFVVPMFSDIFKQTGGQLPWITQVLISLSNKASLFFYSLVLFCISCILIYKTQHQKIWFRKITSSFLLKLPIIGHLIKLIYLSRFCQSMKLLLSSKVLLIDALDLVKNMIGYYPIEHALYSVKKDVYSGKLLNESLQAHSIFPKKLVSLIKVSEEVNAPELIFEKLHQQYSDEIDHQQAIIGKAIEPLFLIILGGIIAFILMAMYSPLFQISSGINAIN